MMHNNYSGSGWWLSRHGEAIRVERHILTVMKRPEVFGIDFNELHRLYEVRREQLGSESTAREVALVRIIRTGVWMRIRHYPRACRWTANVGGISPTVLGLLTSFYRRLYGTGPDFVYTTVRIDYPEGYSDIPLCDFQLDRVCVGDVTAEHPLPEIVVLDDLSAVQPWTLPRVHLFD